MMRAIWLGLLLAHRSAALRCHGAKRSIVVDRAAPARRRGAAIAVAPSVAHPLERRPAVALRSRLRAGADEPEEQGQLSANPVAKAGLISSVVLFLVFGALEKATDGEFYRQAASFVANFNVGAILESVQDRVEVLGPLGLVYFSAVYVAAEVLALPAIPLTASAGYLFGTMQGTAVVLVSATMAAGISFLIGRTLLRGWVEGIASESAQFRAIDTAIQREGFKIILLLRLSPIFPFALSNYFYGLTSVEFGPYITATLIGFAPGTALYVYGGEVASLVSGPNGADATALPWYAYAGILLSGAAIAAKVSEIASDVLKESGMDD